MAHVGPQRHRGIITVSMYLVTATTTAAAAATTTTTTTTTTNTTTGSSSSSSSSSNSRYVSFTISAAEETITRPSVTRPYSLH
jgi:hypothetical protein